MQLLDQRSNTPLMNVTPAVNTSKTGTTYRLGDLTPESPQNPVFKISTVVSANGGASTPTAQVVVETSSDGVNWVQAAAGTVRAADGTTYPEVLDPNGGWLGPYVRAKLLLAGGTLPNATAFVELISNQPFSLF